MNPRAATALCAGSETAAVLAERAVSGALAKAGMTQAGGVLLLLSADLARQAQAAVLAAARAAGCLQVAGAVVPGLFTESGWVLDRPAAAALVLGEGLGLAPEDGKSPLVSFAARLVLPTAWRDGRQRIGVVGEDGPVWQQARPGSVGLAQAAIAGARCRLLVAPGLRLLGVAQPVEQVQGHDVDRIGGLRARDSLARALPAEFRAEHPDTDHCPDLPLHLLAAVRDGGQAPAIPILSANGDGSLTLGERLPAGTGLRWAIRQPLAAEHELRAALAEAAADGPAPDFALMFSCIGRGPLFYGNDDRDLAVFRECCPGVPLLGAYGSGQIAPVAGPAPGNRQWQNTAVTALFSASFESEHV